HWFRYCGLYETWTADDAARHCSGRCSHCSRQRYTTNAMNNKGSLAQTGITKRRCSLRIMIGSRSQPREDDGDRPTCVPLRPIPRSRLRPLVVTAQTHRRIDSLTRTSARTKPLADADVFVAIRVLKLLFPRVTLRVCCKCRPAHGHMPPAGLVKRKRKRVPSLLSFSAPTTLLEHEATREPALWMIFPHAFSLLLTSNIRMYTRVRRCTCARLVCAQKNVIPVRQLIIPSIERRNLIEKIKKALKLPLTLGNVSLLYRRIIKVGVCKLVYYLHSQDTHDDYNAHSSLDITQPTRLYMPRAIFSRNCQKEVYPNRMSARCRTILSNECEAGIGQVMGLAAILPSREKHNSQREKENPATGASLRYTVSACILAACFLCVGSQVPSSRTHSIKMQRTSTCSSFRLISRLILRRHRIRVHRSKGRFIFLSTLSRCSSFGRIARRHFNACVALQNQKLYRSGQCETFCNAGHIRIHTCAAYTRTRSAQARMAATHIYSICIRVPLDRLIALRVTPPAARRLFDFDCEYLPSSRTRDCTIFSSWRHLNIRREPSAMDSHPFIKLSRSAATATTCTPKKTTNTYNYCVGKCRYSNNIHTIYGTLIEKQNAQALARATSSPYSSREKRVDNDWDRLNFGATTPFRLLFAKRIINFDHTHVHRSLCVVCYELKFDEPPERTCMGDGKLKRAAHAEAVRYTDEYITESEFIIVDAINYYANNAIKNLMRIHVMYVQRLSESREKAKEIERKRTRARAYCFSAAHALACRRAHEPELSVIGNLAGRSRIFVGHAKKPEAAAASHCLSTRGASSTLSCRPVAGDTFGQRKRVFARATNQFCLRATGPSYLSCALPTAIFGAHVGSHALLPAKRDLESGSSKRWDPQSTAQRLRASSTVRVAKLTRVGTLCSSVNSHSLEDVPKKLSSAAGGKNPLHTQYAVEPERSRAMLTSIFFSYRNLGTSFIVQGTSRCAALASVPHSHRGLCVYILGPRRYFTRFLADKAYSEAMVEHVQFGLAQKADRNKRKGRRTRTRTQTQPSTSLFSSTMAIRAAHELKRDGWRKRGCKKSSTYLGSYNLNMYDGHLLSIRARYEKRGSGLSDDEVRIKWEDVKSAFLCRIQTGQIVNFKHKDATAFLEDAFTIFEERIKETLAEHSMIKVNVELAAEYMTVNKDGEVIFGDKYFNTKNEHISRSTDLGEWFTTNVQESILKQMEEFAEEGSGWTLSKILHLLVNINKYNPSRVGSFIPLPDTIEKKNAC
ncbi:unnamed protein product, partial [Trichogramma brassicae]